MIRPLNPVDLVSLLLFLGKALPDEAWPPEGLGWGRPTGQDLYLGSWLPFRHRALTLVAVKGVRLQGLASARPRSSPNVWEIRRLIPQDREVCYGLLDGLSAEGSHRGVERLFLRLPSRSPWLGVAQEVGFCLYLAESLYRRLGSGAEGGKSLVLPPLRPRTKGDDYPLFRLYSSAVPEPVRRVRGLTFQEWQQAGEGRGRAKEFVAEDDSGLWGWLALRFQGAAVQFDLMAMPSPGRTDRLLEGCLALCQGSSPLFALVPQFQGDLPPLLLRRGFEEVEEYQSLMRPLTARLRQPSLAPVHA